MMRQYLSFITALGSLLIVSGCANTIDRLERVGEQPPLQPVDNPQTAPQYQPISWPMPNPEPESPRYANSLWRPGARSFFRDQRASRVGDIVRVNVQINDRSEVINETRRQKDAGDEVDVPNLFGTIRGDFLPGDPGNPLIDLESAHQSVGRGQMRRQERIQTQISAVVTQVLPTGNLVIDGSQEILVNFEVRELGVKGIVRPEDIGSDNTVDITQIAEARVIYGGRGQITDIQQPRWGYQVIDAVSPF